jgi:hypothetical protein
LCSFSFTICSSKRSAFIPGISKSRNKYSVVYENSFLSK